MPTAAKQNTTAGGEAFVRYYLEVVNWSVKSLDVRSLRQLFVASCNECTEQVESIDELTARHQYIVGFHYRVAAMDVGPNDGRSGATKAFEVIGIYDEYKTMMSGDQVVKDYVATKEPYMFYLRWNGSAWIVVDRPKLDLVIN